MRVVRLAVHVHVYGKWRGSCYVIREGKEDLAGKGG